MKLEKAYAESHLRLHNLSVIEYEEQHGTPTAIASEETASASPPSVGSAGSANSSLASTNASTIVTSTPTYTYRQSCSSQQSNSTLVTSAYQHIVDTVPEPGFPLTVAQQHIHPPGI